MQSYCWSSMKNNPSRVILHADTNDLSSTREAEEIAQDIVTLANDLKNESNEVVLSGTIPRRDEWNMKGKSFNNYVRKLCLTLNIGFIYHNNINIKRDLDERGLHLDGDVVDIFFNNLLETVTC